MDGSSLPENLLPPQSTAERIRHYVDRVRGIREEIKGLNGDVSDLYGAAANDGLDKDVLKALVKRLDKDPSILEAQDNLLALYEDQYRNGVTQPSRARAREVA